MRWFHDAVIFNFIAALAYPCGVEANNAGACYTFSQSANFPPFWMRHRADFYKYISPCVAPVYITCYISNHESILLFTNVKLLASDLLW